MAFRVRITPKAQRDAEEIYRRVIAEAPRQGALWFNGLMDNIHSLANHPRRCPLAEGFPTVKEIRQLFYGRRPYILFFRIKKDEVQILHIRRGARKPWSQTLDHSRP